MNEKQISRFWSKVDIQGVDECWLWKTGINGTGYGCFSITHGVKISSHRMAFELTFGKIPEGKFVCHRCDVRRCCNPNHLWIGTAAENLHDMKIKGRAAKGERNAAAKLTWDKVIEIRELYARGGLSYEKVGKMFSVSDQTAWRVVKRKDWAHERN